ncbi:ATP-dependent DNA helicase MER3, partial [Dispira parvispora]
LMYCDDNIVVSAPTGSGKTCLFELALVQLFQRHEHQCKAIYMAPTKALCSERCVDWQRRFGALGYTCNEVTGDSEFTHSGDILRSSLIITTPEKWDALSRRWTDHSNLMKKIQLVMIDEVHILQEKRGATLEAVVSRMRIINPTIRYIAVSATVPNIGDIAQWLCMEDINEVDPSTPPKHISAEQRNETCRLPARVFTFGEEYRPVPLQRFVYSYESRGDNGFLFERNLDYRLPGIIEQHSGGYPVLVFCSTRKSAQQACEYLAKQYSNGALVSQTLADPSAIKSFKDKRLRAFHHAGLEVTDRRLVESLFISGSIRVACTTSTLAIGVNLPARLVIIKSTRGYHQSQYTEYSTLDILQMLGRAGRPQFDTVGVAVILTTRDKQYHYENLIAGQEDVESSLHSHLIEHINAEISLGSVQSVQAALQWLKSSFLYVRVCSNLSYYPLDGKEFTNRTPHQYLEELGTAMARYYIAFTTMETIVDSKEKANNSDILKVLSQAQEYSELRFQVGEKSVLNELNKHVLIKHPVKGRVRTIDQKVYLLFQIYLGNLNVTGAKISFQMQNEIRFVVQQAHRVLKCFMEVTVSRQDTESLLNALLLCQCLRAQSWDRSYHVLKQVDKIGNQYAKVFGEAGVKTLDDLKILDAQQIETILNRNPPFGNQIREAVQRLPWLTVDGTRGQSNRDLEVRMRLENAQVRTALNGQLRWAVLVVFTELGRLVTFRRFPLAQLKEPKVIKLYLAGDSASQPIHCVVVSEDVVGVGGQCLVAPLQLNDKCLLRTCPDQGSKVDDEKSDFELLEACKDTHNSFASIKDSQENYAPNTKTTCIDSTPPTHVPCSHRCADKHRCKHVCCKTGRKRKVVSDSTAKVLALRNKTPRQSSPIVIDDSDDDDTRCSSVNHSLVVPVELSPVSNGPLSDLTLVPPSPMKVSGIMPGFHPTSTNDPTVLTSDTYMCSVLAKTETSPQASESRPTLPNTVPVASSPPRRSLLTSTVQQGSSITTTTPQPLPSRPQHQDSYLIKGKEKLHQWLRQLRGPNPPNQ